MKRVSRKILVNGDRIVGLVKPYTGRIGALIEYGTLRDGILNVSGIGRIERDKIYDFELETLSTYDGYTGVMLS